MVLEKTLESPLDCKEIQPVHPKGGQSWLFIGRTDVEAEAPVLWPPDTKSWLVGKDCDSGKDWGQEEKGTTEDEMVGWHHRLNGHEYGWTLGVGDRQGGLACCGSWSHKELDTLERLNWNEVKQRSSLKEPGFRPKFSWLQKIPPSEALNQLLKCKGVYDHLCLPKLYVVIACWQFSLASWKLLMITALAIQHRAGI